MALRAIIHRRGHGGFQSVSNDLGIRRQSLDRFLEGGGIRQSTYKKTAQYIQEQGIALESSEGCDNPIEASLALLADRLDALADTLRCREFSSEKRLMDATSTSAAIFDYLADIRQNYESANK